MDTAAMADLVDAEVEDVLNLRRRLHAVPELGGLEHRTSDLIRGALPIDAEAVAGTGLLARLGARRHRPHPMDPPTGAPAVHATRHHGGLGRERVFVIEL